MAPTPESSESGPMSMKPHSESPIPNSQSDLTPISARKTKAASIPTVMIWIV